MPGTGPGGRITEDDVRRAKEAAGKKPEVRIKAKFDFYGALDRIPLRGIRRATARRLTESIRKAVHVTHFDEADAAGLVALRKKLKPEAEAQGLKLTYLPFIVRAVVEALKLHPMLNSTVDDEAEEIVVKKYYNIGIAVDVPDGLIVPVVKGADMKTVLEIAGDIQNLAEAARKRTLDLADLKGGTFSITNVGAIGGDAATPIINYPETAILATMRIGERVRAVNGAAVVRTDPSPLPVLRPPRRRRRRSGPLLEGPRPVPGIPGGLSSRGGAQVRFLYFSAPKVRTNFVPASRSRRRSPSS